MMLEINGWKVGIKFSASHFVPGHYKCSRLHGHDYGVRVRIYGEPENCVLYDFVELKRKLRGIVEEIDHHLIVPKNQEYIRHEINEDEVRIEFEGKKYSIPREDVIFLDLKLATAEELSRYLAERIKEELNFPPNVKGIEICVDEGPGQGACHYIPLGD